MTINTNFWVTKRYQRVVDNKWMCFLWGMQATSMLEALTVASHKKHTELKITEVSPALWEVIDQASDARYTVEMRDAKPDIAYDSVRDQTYVKTEIKRMPKPGSLFLKQVELF